MTLKRVDVEGDVKIEGYSYENICGGIEHVTIPDKGVVDVWAEADYVSIYTEDIPKLIKALEAAYNHKEGI